MNRPSKGKETSVKTLVLSNVLNFFSHRDRDGKAMSSNFFCELLTQIEFKYGISK